MCQREKLAVSSRLALAGASAEMDLRDNGGGGYGSGGGDSGGSVGLGGVTAFGGAAAAQDNWRDSRPLIADQVDSKDRLAKRMQASGHQET